MQVWIWRAVALALPLALVGCGGGEKPTPGNNPAAPAANSGGGADNTVTVKGSDTMLDLAGAWREDFQAKNAGMKVDVTGGGSGVGITGLVDGTTEIATASREIKDEEREKIKGAGGDVQEFVVARDALTVGVHPSNPVTQLTFEQLSGIYSGKITDWGQVGGKAGKITVVSRDKNSGTYQFFLEHVIQQGDSKSPLNYAGDVLLQPSNKAIVTEVAQNPNAIGYYGMAHHNPSALKAVSVAAKTGEAFVAPSLDAVKAGNYPLSRPLYLYTSRTPEGPVKQFIDYALSPDGQKIAESEGVGFVAAK